MNSCSSQGAEVQASEHSHGECGVICEPVSSLLLALRVSMVFVSFSTESGGLEGLRLVIYLDIFLRLAPKSQSTHERALEVVSGPVC